MADESVRNNRKSYCYAFSADRVSVDDFCGRRGCFGWFADAAANGPAKYTIGSVENAANVDLSSASWEGLPTTMAVGNGRTWT